MCRYMLALFVFLHMIYSLDTSIFLDKVTLRRNAFRCCLLICFHPSHTSHVRTFFGCRPVLSCVKRTKGSRAENILNLFLRQQHQCCLWVAHSARGSLESMKYVWGTVVNASVSLMLDVYSKTLFDIEAMNDCLLPWGEPVDAPMCWYEPGQLLLK